jgi:hypothetical protein
LVQASGGKVHIPRDVLSGLDAVLAEQVFRPASLVGGYDMLVTVVSLDGILQVIEVNAACVGFIAKHHARPLPVAHGAGSTIG